MRRVPDLVSTTPSAFTDLFVVAERREIELVRASNEERSM
jgi:hypothetical protein